MQAQNVATPATAHGVPVSRDAWTQATNIEVRDPRAATVQAMGTPSPTSIAASSPAPQGNAYAQTPPPAPTRGRRAAILAIVASSVLTAVIAILASRGCGGSGGATIDAGVGSGSGVAVVGSGSVGNAPIDASVVDAAVVATNHPTPDARTPDARTPDPTTKGTASKGTVAKGTAPKGTAGKGTQPKTTTTTQPTTDPTEPPRNDRLDAGIATAPTPDPEPPPPVRKEIHDGFYFAKGDHQATLGQRALDRVAASHRLDPTRRIIITGHAEQDEPGVLEKLAGARANTAYTHLASRGVSREILVVNTTRYIDPATPDGANRRVTIDFE